MRRNTLKSKLSGLVFLGVLALVLGSSELAGQMHDSSSRQSGNVGVVLKGGFAHSESRSGLVDVGMDVAFSLSPSLRAVFGIGYMSDSDNRHMDGGFGGMSGGMMGGGMGEMSGQFSGHSHAFRVIPVALSLQYALPVNPNLDVFMIGGGGYYFGSFRDISRQNKSAFGPHFGIGLDLKIAERVMISAEGIYRFVNLKNFESELHPGFREAMDSEQHEEGFWHFHHGQEEWHFHEEHEDLDQMMDDVSPFNISLNGFSLRAGIKFRF